LIKIIPTSIMYIFVVLFLLIFGIYLLTSSTGFHVWSIKSIIYSENPENIPSPVENKAADELNTADFILLGARAEAKNQTHYDASYAVIAYPGGDVPEDSGACTDVVIRAFRNAGIDLQQLIHEDMAKNFDIYPQNWGLDGPDANIDHRRVPNQVVFFKRYGLSLGLNPEENPDEWQWGDVIYWRFINGDEHCGIISDRRTSDGIPLVIHNAGICTEEDSLLRWEITEHYRFPADGI